MTTEAALTMLRETFPDAAVGKLPRVTCKTCRDRRGACDQHAMTKCAGCGNYMSNAHIHIDYVGHASVTDRLLTADPLWNWEPVARDVDPHLLASAIETGNPDVVRVLVQSSPPRFVRNENDAPVGLWIKLTICGVTRLGYGSLDQQKLDGEKELVGDAIRNAAMRFGVALALWSKAELESVIDDTPGAPAHKRTRRAPPASAPLAPPADVPRTETPGTARRVRAPAPTGAQASEEQRRRLTALARARDMSTAELLAYVATSASRTVTALDQLSITEANTVLDQLKEAP